MTPRPPSSVSSRTRARQQLLVEQQKVVRPRTMWPPPFQEVTNFCPSRRTRSRRFNFSEAVRPGDSEESMAEEEGEALGTSLAAAFASLAGEAQCRILSDV